LPGLNLRIIIRPCAEKLHSLDHPASGSHLIPVVGSLHTQILFQPISTLDQLNQSGVQAITLYDSVDPRRRERWIEDHGFVDTLITNPHLVQTGLDLVTFQTVVLLVLPVFWLF
jgi:hypothetical protein